jgi:predicted Fe-S protein YdhL (DUF1289 family)
MDTPCVRVCRIDEDLGYCYGCGRTRREIAEWTGLSKNERLTVMATCLVRLTEMTRGAEKGKRNDKGRKST